MPHEQALNRKMERPSLLALSRRRFRHMYDTTCGLERCRAVIRALFIAAMCPRHYRSRWLPLWGNVPGFIFSLLDMLSMGTYACRRRDTCRQSAAAREPTRKQKESAQMPPFRRRCSSVINTCPPSFSTHKPGV